MGLARPAPAVGAPEREANEALDARARRWVGRALAVGLLLLIYGCLVPLRFEGLALAEAVEAFLSLPPPGGGQISRVDIAVNVVILVPLTFLATHLMWLRKVDPQSRSRQRWVSRAAVAVVLAGAFVLSLSIEFAQQFVVSRVPSLTDVASQVVGAVIGLLLHRWQHWHFHAWLLGVLRPQAGLDDRLTSAAAAYVLLLVAYGLMPLDISPHPVDLYRKWRDGFVVLVPFGFAWPSWGAMLHGAMLDVLLWVPLGWWWARRHGRVRAALGRALMLALALELLQLPIQSRVSDITDLFWALLGAGAGAWAAHGRWNLLGAVISHQPARWAAFGALWLVWLTMVLYQAWYPFDLDLSGWRAVGLWDGLSQVPFSGKYVQSPLSALGDLLGKLCLFLAGGVLLGLGVTGPMGRILDSERRAAFTLLLVCALASEGGQVLLASRQADVADMALKALGGWLGLLLAAWLIERRPGGAGVPASP